jgi:CopG family nickel-responsive transcriptional regulator
MMSDGNGTNVISISLPGRTVEAMEKAITEMGYVSRSELVRDALREFMRKKATLEDVEGNVEGVITILYGHDSDDRVSSVRHRHMGAIRSFMHSDFSIDHATCCEVMMFSGKASDVRQAFNELKAVKGVDEAYIFIAKTG